MGGTNDLAIYTPGDIYDNIQKICEVACKACTHLVVLSIPDAAFKEDWYVGKRKQVNENLKKYVVEKKYLFLDVESKVPYQDANSKLWDDTLHFSPAGYDKVGQLVYETIAPTLSAKK